MVDDFARQNAEAYRDALGSMIVNRFLPRLVIWMGNNWIVAALNESGSLGLQVDDVLISPL